MFSDKNIVVLDDDVAITDSIGFFIKKKNPNNSITTYNTVEDFKIDYSRSYTNDITCEVDVLIIDYYLEGIVGPEVVKNIRKFNKDIFIIVASGAFMSETNGVRCVNMDIMKEAMNAGANRVIPKVIDDIIEAMDIHFKIQSTT